jgi:HAD superfamily hydrolase (TIGR01509 family)
MSPAPFAVIFDADGVLFDTEEISLAAFKETAAELGLRLEEEDIAASCGQTDAALVARLAREYGTRIEYEEFKRRMFERYCARIEQEGLRVFEGATELHSALHEQQVLCALASSGSPEKIEFNLLRTEMAERFRVIVSGEALGTSKPDPTIFLHTAELLEIAAGRCVVIEDSINGVSAAKAAGMSCVAVTNTFHRTQLRHADLLVDSLRELSFVRLQDLALRQTAEEITP